VIETNEVYDATANESQFFPKTTSRTRPRSPASTRGPCSPPSSPKAGGSGRLYAPHHDGTNHPGGPFVSGWPVKIDGLAIDVLPLIGPGHNVTVGELDPSPGLEVAGELTSANLALFRPDGTRLRDMDPSAHRRALRHDPGQQQHREPLRVPGDRRHRPRRAARPEQRSA